MRSKFRLLVAGLVFTGTGVVSAAEAPVAVSPGSPTGSRVEGRCPTFSWGAVPGARRYELVIYRVGGDEVEARPVVEQEIPGSASSWTPPLESCLERGGDYAWSVRALGGKTASEWSVPSLFQVASGPSVEELEAALEAVGAYARHRTAEAGVREADANAPPIGAGPGAFPSGASNVASALTAPGRSHEGTGSAIVVDGAFAETKADPPCYPLEGDPDEDDRFIDCDNGTVLDTVTGLLWLKWANCRSCIPPTVPCPVSAGLRTWYEANVFAANVRDGFCNLTDHSQRGDWRLATREEWEPMLEPDCPEAPKIAGRGGGCYSDGSWASELESAFYWSSSSTALFPNAAWIASIGNGQEGGDAKNHDAFTWAVRGGQ